MVDNSLIEYTGTTANPTVTLAVGGWNRIAEIERQKVGKDSRQAFVAMCFDENLYNVYKN